MMRRPSALPVRITLCVVVAAAAALLPRLASSATARSPVACKPWQALQVTGSDGQKYVIRNKPSINHNDQGMCISSPGLASGFTVTRSPGMAPSSTVRAYPYIATGCFEGACAADGEGTPPQAGALGSYTVSWTTATKARGVWDSSLDLWLGPRTGVGRSEIMIWLRYSKPAWWAKKYPTVRIDGAKWYVVPHATAPGRYYLSFRRATPVNGATLRLAPFTAAAEQRGALSPSSRLWCVQAGFEIWSGGKGLAIKSFAVTR